MNVLFFLFAMLMPWVLGFLIVKPFLNRRRGYLPFAIGAGYVLGWFVVILVFRGYDYFQRPFDIYEIVLIQCLIAIPLMFLKVGASDGIKFKQDNRDSKLTYVLVTAVVLLLLYRWGLTLVDLLSKPVFPWDGWFSWAAKAKAFYYAQKISPLISIEYPFWSFKGEDVFFVGEMRHPHFVSLIQTYTAMAWGEWRDGVVSLPWLGLSVAMSLTVFGGLRYLGAKQLPAILTAYAVVSLPVLDIHVSLGSYADAWVGLALLVFAYILVFFLTSGKWKILFLLFAFLLIGYFTKGSSLVFFLTLSMVVVWRLFGALRSMLLLSFMLIGLYLISTNLFGPKFFALLTKLFSSGITQQMMKYHPVADKVWQEWMIFNNHHYVLIAGLISLFFLAFNNTMVRGRFYGFVLLSVAGISCLLLFLAIVFFTTKMAGSNFFGYFNRVSLFFIPLLSLVSVSVYHLCEKKH